MNTFFIVGPTATGKSELAAEVAARLEAEVVSADAYQIYQGLDLLTAKPNPSVIGRAPHHLLSVIPLSEEMNAEKFRVAAEEALGAIHHRGRLAIVVGGSGLYIKALTHGLSKLPSANAALRQELERASMADLYARFRELDPEGATKIDRKNKRRLIRALEVCLVSGQPFSAQRTRWEGERPKIQGVFVFRERAELYERINRRVDQMFAEGVEDEVRRADRFSGTAEKALGLREIRARLAGEISKEECISTVKRLTRNYAKRQLTWFQRQDIIISLNLSLYGWQEAIELIAQNARSAVAPRDD